MMRPMKSLILFVLSLVLVAPLARTADAAPKKKKYHFQLTKDLVKPEVKGEAGKTAQARVEAVFKKALSEHPQLVADIGEAPDPAKDNGTPYRKWLTKKGISG